MDRAEIEENQTVINSFVELLSQRKNSKRERIIVFAGAAISIHAPSYLPLAYEMLAETTNVLLEDHVLKTALQNASVFDQLRQFINKNSTIIPPEMFYDAIYEFAGDKVFGALECLKSNQPNLNHKIIASLLENGYIDYVITTNFDRLIEQSFSKRFRFSWPWEQPRIWKIHGDIRTPHTMVTTMRRVGQTAFDEKQITRLHELLEGSHVLFIGYGGADPDLIPAFMTAKMKSVYWSVLRKEDIDNNMSRPLWKAVQGRTPIKWVVGDLQSELLDPIAVELNTRADHCLLPTRAQSEHEHYAKDHFPLQESMERWKNDRARKLSPIEKARSILQILYHIALFSSHPISLKEQTTQDFLERFKFSKLEENIDAWILIIKTANALLKDSVLSNRKASEFQRDLHAFQAESYLKLGSFLELLDQAAKIQDGLSPDSQPVNVESNSVMFQHRELRQQYFDIVRKLRESSLTLDKAHAGEVGQLFAHAKNHLTPILSLPLRDAVQVQALLNASTILISLASRRSPEDEWRNIRGAEAMLKKGLWICDQARMDTDKRNILKARCYSNLAVTSIGQSNLKKGLRQFGKAEALFRRSGDLYSYLVTCINIGLLYMEIYRRQGIESYRDTAEKYSQRSRALLTSFPNQALNEKAANLEREIYHANSENNINFRFGGSK